MVCVFETPGREDVKYSWELNLALCLRKDHGCVCSVVSLIGFHFPHKTKQVRQSLPRICQFYNGVSILIISVSRYTIKPRE